MSKEVCKNGSDHVGRRKFFFVSLIIREKAKRFAKLILSPVTVGSRIPRKLVVRVYPWIVMFWTSRGAL